MSGILYIVPTPIGNLEDITLRALRILREADIIAAEDTRKTAGLLNHFEIKKPLISYYEHNKRTKGGYILEQLENDKNIALVSDAGSPGICDPGADLIAEVLQANLQVVVLPGACAAVMALIAGGLNTERFAFEGFLPREKNKRKKALQALCAEERTLVFYEAPHRIAAVLLQAAEILGNRKAALCRELTKKFEEIERKTLVELAAEYAQREPKGEFVLVIEGAKKQEKIIPAEEKLLSEMIVQMENGFSRKMAAKLLAEKYQISSKELYDMSLQKK